MLGQKHQKALPGLIAGLLLLIPLFAIFPRQNVETSPTPSPSPTATLRPAVVARASPTPPTGALNFHQWGSVTLFNGLPSDNVRSIAQTPDGVMWFGTENGLARFDGRRVQNFSFGASEANRVLALRTSPTGELWIGTQKGAYVYDGESFQGVAGLEGLCISAMFSGDENLLGTDSGLVFRVVIGEGSTRTATKVFETPIQDGEGNPLRITTVVKLDGKIIAGTSGRGAFVADDGVVSEFQGTPRPVFVNALAVSKTGKLWFGTDAAKGLSGIYGLVNASHIERVAAPTANVLALETNDSGLWAGTERYGLFQIAGDGKPRSYSFENTSGGLRSNTIFTIFTDREGVVWIGTNRGVSRFDRLGAFQATVSDIPNSNFIRTLYQTPGTHGHLFAGSNRGLFELDEKDHWNEIPGLRNKSVYAVKQRNETSIVVGTADGMFDIGGKRAMDGDIRSFGAFNGHDYAAVFGRGVVDITVQGQPVVYASEAVTSVFSGSNKLWIGTLGLGLFSYDGTNVDVEATPDQLKSGTIWNMYQAGPDAPLYIAGQHGVFSLDEGKVEQIITAEDVRDVLETDGQIWAATTTRGLLHARHDDRFGWLVSSVGFEQGMPSEKAFSIRRSELRLTIATNRGVVTYTPGTIAPKLIPTRILSRRTHELSELRSTIALDYPQNSLTVEMAGQSSRTFPEEFQYAFLLRNSKGEIVDSRFSSDPQYAPANLSPGVYRIESQAFDRDLLTSEPFIMTFSVARAPFPWTATSLGILLFIAVVALVWAVLERRQIVLRNQELATARLDLANEAERERRRIARDLHDQTLADLRDLMMTSDQIAPDNQKFRNEVEAISVEIRRICEDLSPSVLENVGLVAALEFLLSNTTPDHYFSAAETTGERSGFRFSVELQIYRIAQEILTNIKRHSSATRVEMNVDVTADGEFVLTISDNGGVFAPADVTAAGRGISNIRSRASLIGADISWRERDGGGTTFCLRIRVVK